MDSHKHLPQVHYDCKVSRNFYVCLSPTPVIFYVFLFHEMLVRPLLPVFCFESEVSLQNVLLELCPDGYCGIPVNMVVKGK